MFHYTYKIYYSDSKFYIGVRTSKVYPTEDDKYIGSSKKTPNNLIIKKEILQIFPTRKLALEHEILLHEELDIAVNPLYYNACKQLSNGFDVTGIQKENSHKEKISKALYGIKHTDERKENMRIGKELAIPFRKKRIVTKEHREKISNILKGKPTWISGKKFSKEYRIDKYESRTIHKELYKWINIETKEIVEKTCQEMGIDYGTRRKSSSQFINITTGIAKTYKKWTLLEMYNNKTYKRIIKK